MNINPFSTQCVTVGQCGGRRNQDYVAHRGSAVSQSKELDFKNKGLGIKHNGKTVDGFGSAGEPGGACASCPPSKKLHKK